MGRERSNSGNNDEDVVHVDDDAVSPAPAKKLSKAEKHLPSRKKLTKKPAPMQLVRDCVITGPSPTFVLIVSDPFKPGSQRTFVLASAGDFERWLVSVLDHIYEAKNYLVSDSVASVRSDILAFERSTRSSLCDANLVTAFRTVYPSLVALGMEMAMDVSLSNAIFQTPDRAATHMTSFLGSSINPGQA